MPFWGLVATSAGFLAPAIIAWKKRRPLHAFFSTLLALTSTLYHGTVHPIAHRVDKFYAHMIGAHFIGRGLFLSLVYGRHLCLAGTSAILWVYFGRSQRTDGFESKMWHMTLHIIAATGWAVYLYKESSLFSLSLQKCTNIASFLLPAAAVPSEVLS